jgi:hypothetical protein
VKDELEFYRSPTYRRIQVAGRRIILLKGGTAMNDHVYAKEIEALGMTRSQRRHWESKGILRPVRKGRWRLYSPVDVEKVRKMLWLLKRGMTLDGAARMEGKLPEETVVRI